jgi:protein-S-isoprenylcysteine O-methyltransferase Ste14
VRFAHEIVIVVMEILGMLLVSAGLGCVASWWFGLAGLLAISGMCVLAFATLIALRQKSINAPPQPPTGR